MPALTTRQLARQRLIAEAMKNIDALVPADESAPMAGKTFLEFEQMAAEADRRFRCTAVEELAKLSDTARVVKAGICPQCKSINTRLRHEEKEREIQSPVGSVKHLDQTGRCNDCGCTFSPSAP